MHKYISSFALCQYEQWHNEIANKTNELTQEQVNGALAVDALFVKNEPF
jgi:hypothetical protein